MISNNSNMLSYVDKREAGFLTTDKERSWLEPTISNLMIFTPS